MQTYYNPLNCKYYALIEEGFIITCSKCNKVINLFDTFVHQHSYGKRYLKVSNWCTKCFVRPIKQIVDEFRIVQLVDIVPYGSKLCVDVPPQLTSGEGKTVFSVALDQEEGVQVNNHCKVSIQADRNMMPALEAAARPNLSKLAPDIMLSLILDAEPMPEVKRLR